MFILNAREDYQAHKNEAASVDRSRVDCSDNEHLGEEAGVSRVIVGLLAGVSREKRAGEIEVKLGLLAGMNQLKKTVSRTNKMSKCRVTLGTSRENTGRLIFG